MAAKSYTYDNIEDPYDALMQRGGTPFPNLDLGDPSVGGPSDVKENSLDGKTFSNMTLSNTMKSENYKTKKKGFLIDGKMGYIECMKLFVGTGGIIGGKLDIPNTTSDDSFHVDSLGNTWWGANNANEANAPARVDNNGDALFQNVIITGTSTIGGTLATTIGGAINIDGDFINDLINTNFNTATAEILGGFVFGASGAIKMLTNNDTGLWISPGGILGQKVFPGDTLPTITFAVTTSGDATFRGSITASDITGGTMTGGVIKTADTDNRVQLDSNYFKTYSGGKQRVWINQDSINFYDSAETPVGTIYGDTGTMELLVPFGGQISLTTTHNPTTEYPIKLQSRTGTGVYSEIARVGYEPVAALSYIRMQGANNRIEAKSFLVGASGYFNFGATPGTSGYGLRDNSGTMQWKNSGGAWADLGAGGGGGISWSTPVNANILPDANNTRGIGEETNTFSDIYGQSIYAMNNMYTKVIQLGSGTAGGTIVFNDFLYGPRLAYDGTYMAFQGRTLFSAGFGIYFSSGVGGVTKRQYTEYPDPDAPGKYYLRSV